MNVGLINYVYGDYQDFIPLYVHSVVKNNPDIGIKIFLKETLTDTNRKLLEKVSFNNLQIIENYFIPCPIARLSGIRFLIPKKDVSEFDYIFLSDIDVVRIPNMTNKSKLHIERCKETQLPFNAFFYTSSFNVDGVKVELPRFNGACVFIKVKSYYAKMSGIIEEIYSDKHKDYMDKIKYLNSDELLLYYMLERVFKFDVNLFKKFNHYGVNLGCLRHGFKNTWVPSDKIEEHLVTHILENSIHNIKDVFILAKNSKILFL